MNPEDLSGLNEGNQEAQVNLLSLVLELLISSGRTVCVTKSRVLRVIAAPSSAS
jgi:hypothetical protein